MMKPFRRQRREPEAVQIQEIDERHNLSQQVFFRRELACWSQDELAERAGTTQAQIANVEAGNVNPTLLTLVKLANVFGCLAHDLLRPLETADDLERPNTRDWGAWSDALQEEEVQRGVPDRGGVVLQFPQDVADIAVLPGGGVNDALALTS